MKPSFWGHCHILFNIKIFKAGNVEEMQNFRHVCVLTSLAQIFKTILYNIMMKNVGDIFAPQQSGFLQWIICVFWLTLLVNQLTTNKVTVDLKKDWVLKSFWHGWPRNSVKQTKRDWAFMQPDIEKCKVMS